jgi:PDGLE domain
MTRPRRHVWMFVLGGLLVAFGLAFFASPYASSSPDGLEKVATDEGFIDTAEDHAMAGGPLADYGVEGIDDEGLSTGVAGVIGVTVTFGLGLILVGALRMWRGAAPPEPGPSPSAGTPSRA